ncbi:MAG: phosphotransferase [Gammaproteobacteria bacterium]|nr:phosphotransferase [Gammaproteobacteria bacterium]MDH5652449.1 phosphotransferase [Gammaproteobacteria bacterium]
MTDYSQDARVALMHRWLRNDLQLGEYAFAPASADASFRRYFRISLNGETRIVMDAPPDKEDTHPFVGIARLFLQLGLHVPEILAQNETDGFLLLSDLGSTDYLRRLNDNSEPQLYGAALTALLKLQICPLPAAYPFPPYNKTLLLNEMGLFTEWYLGRHLHIELNDQQQAMFDHLFELLADNALQQPQVVVHRDYHSRNLMVSEPNPGVLDFQDAVIGPVTYDLVSLLRDCYIAWPRSHVEQRVADYHRDAIAAGILSGVDFAQFLRWFDLMGVQRHLKATGIFARLNYRDGKAGYLPDIPRTMGYVKEVASRYTELADFAAFIAELEQRGERYLAVQP